MTPAALIGFDLLELRSRDLRPLSLSRRKKLLTKVLEGSTTGIVYSEHLDGDGAEVFAAASRMDIEGIVSKRCDRAYISGPCKHWVRSRIRTPRLCGVSRKTRRTEVNGTQALGGRFGCMTLGPDAASVKPDWSRQLIRPIELADGTVLHTLQDAAERILELPDLPSTRVAAERIIAAATKDGDMISTHAAIRLALLKVAAK
jgi:hypothetical protein